MHLQEKSSSRRPQHGRFGWPFYLVKEQTNNKLSKFMTVGSPHQGLPLAYPAWSAGEIWEDDLLTQITSTLLIRSCELYQGQVR
jgi:hypothetical protein